MIKITLDLPCEKTSFTFDGKYLNFPEGISVYHYPIAECLEHIARLIRRHGGLEIAKYPDCMDEHQKRQKERDKKLEDILFNDPDVELG